MAGCEYQLELASLRCAAGSRPDKKIASAGVRRTARSRRRRQPPLHPGSSPTIHKNLGFKPGDFPEAEKYYSGAITLPIFPRMTQDELNFVIAQVRKVLLS